MTDTDRDWKIWAETDPYYAVLAAPQFRKDRLDLDEFFLTGSAYVADRLDMLERQLGAMPRGRALDFGCGVGRVALPLGAHFDEVLGLDVAPAMLAEAEALKSAQGARNVHFALSDDRLTTAPGRFDFVHSYIVFQHIPPQRGLPIIDLLLDRVTPGGVANIHVAFGGEERPLRNFYYAARARFPVVQRIVHALRGKNPDEPVMQMNAYPLRQVFAMLHARGFGQAVVDVEPHGKFLTMHIAAKRKGEGA
jgi:SAM-dependent methyltransferase